MEPESFEKVARALFPVVDRFQLTVSGEPLMSKGLGRMLQLAEEYGVRTEYYTNGTLLNDRMIAMILPTLGSMCHGGIWRVATRSLMDRAQGRASWKVTSDIGAIEFG